MAEKSAVCPRCSEPGLAAVLYDGPNCERCGYPDDRTSTTNAWRVPRPEQVRGSTHGDYTHMAITIQNIKNAMHSGEAWSQCSASQREALELTATKIGRIVCGDPNHVDHWDDIIGYCNLAKDRIARAHKTPENGA